MVALVRRNNGIFDLEFDLLCKLTEWSVEEYNSVNVEDNLL